MDGRRNRVMISCVTFETVKISEPIKYYEATRVHLIHYVRDPDSEKGRIYSEFFDRVCELIEESHPEIIEYNENVSDFSTMLKTVFSIIEYENSLSEKSDIYVNISAGSSEYAAAATIASMMLPNTIPFAIASDTYTVDTNVREVFYDGGKPVGLTKKVRSPKTVPKYFISVPERHLIEGLKIVYNMEKEKHYPKGKEVISILKEKGLWYRGEEFIENEADRERMSRTDSVYYQRDFLSKWVDNGWIYKDKLRKRYLLTDEGRSAVETFYLEEFGGIRIK